MYSILTTIYKYYEQIRQKEVKNRDLHNQSKKKLEEDMQAMKRIMADLRQQQKTFMGK